MMSHEWLGERDGTSEYGSANFTLGRPRKWKDDLESLFFSMLSINRIKLPWHRRRRTAAYNMKSNVRKNQVSNFCSSSFST